jgi:hypothetical protein
LNVFLISCNFIISEITLSGHANLKWPDGKILSGEK